MVASKFLGRELVTKPTCPFCGLVIERPKELRSRMPGEMPVGSCSCGAVYACDVTGHNLGSAMIEALVFACDLDWDLAWSLLPEEDYREEIVKHYDVVTNLVVPGGYLESRRISGALFFIRLHDEVLEVTAEAVNQKLARATPVAAAPPSSPEPYEALSKKEVEDLVRDFEPEPILRMARKDARIIRKLQRLLYSGDDLFRQKAAEILGEATAIIAETDPGAVSQLLQRLFTAIWDSAACTWGAFEAIGEIISQQTELFAGYIPSLCRFLPDKARRAQALQAIGKVARARPELISGLSSYCLPLLIDPDHLVRGHAARLLGDLGASEAREGLERLLEEDSEELVFYEHGRLQKLSVAQVASEALAKLGISRGP